MGMYTYVKGFVPPDEKWQKMKTIWDACESAGVSTPKEVGDFFDWTSPTDAGMEVSLPGAVTEGKGSHDMEQAWDVDISKLPKNVTIIRFVNSY